ncbi:MAG: hypothetical protein WDM77_01835 [Steroidobacteraceae bacterium]
MPRVPTAQSGIGPSVAPPLPTELGPLTAIVPFVYSELVSQVRPAGSAGKLIAPKVPVSVLKDRIRKL